MLELIEDILELIEDIVKGEELVVLFSQWLDTLDLFEDVLTDRLHRIGQTKTVFVHHVQTSDTLKEKAADLQARERGLSDRIMAAADRPLQWTREELLALLKPLP